MTTRQINPSLLLPGICRTNPSICTHRGQNYLSYRIEQHPPNRASWTAVCRCDAEWNPIAPSVLLALDIPRNSDGDYIAEDCRLFSRNNQLCFAVTNRDRMWAGILGSDLSVSWSRPFNPLSVKNWTPTCDASICWLVWPTHQRCLYEWEYGEPRGGTPLIRYGAYQVGFFHSHIFAENKPPPVNHPSDIALAACAPRRTVFGSPYALSDNGGILFPKRPLIWPKIYSRQDRAPNNHDTVFPCGIVRTGERWTVSYGDDKDCWLADFSTEEIFEVLQPI